MSCSSCGNNNSFTSCGCSDNCPSKTSDITLFDGVLSSINVPVGADLNDVLALLELFVLNSVNNLSLNIDLLSTNCLGLPAGTYGIQQVMNAIIDTLCGLPCPLFVEINTIGVKNLQATATGGTSPYTYSWSFKDNIDVLNFGGATNTNTVNITGTPGAFALPTCIVTDANGCKSSATFLWVQPAE